MDNSYKPVSGKELLKAIQMYDFALIELNLFLDTHPDDKKALAKFNEINPKREMAYKAYAEKYGTITATQANYDKSFHWTDGPWPWERGAN